MSALQQTLRQARRRMTLASLLRDGVRSALFASLAGLCAMTALSLRGAPPLGVPALLTAAAAGLGSFVFLALRHRFDLVATARRLDQLGGTRDRFSVGLALQGNDDAPLARLAVEDCQAFAGNFDPLPLVPLRVPRSAWALLAPAVAALFLTLQYETAHRVGPAARAAQEHLAQKADELAKLQAEIEQAAREDSRLRALAEAARKAVEQLRLAAADRDADPGEALKQLSALESMIDALQKALTAQNKAIDQAAEQAQAGDAAAATASLQAAARASLSEQERQQLDQAAADARATGKMSEQDRQQALERLAEQMRRMSRQTSQSGNGDSSERQLQRMKNTVQDMKSGQSGPGGRPREGQDPSGQRSFVQSSGETPKSSGPGDGESELPGGNPGGENDPGTTKSPYGSQASAEPRQGQDTNLNSLLGEGESLSDLVPAAAGDTSKSTRRYRDLYNAVAADAPDTVDREDIPLASRFYIKRYFENIRPAE